MHTERICMTEAERIVLLCIFPSRRFYFMLYTNKNKLKPKPSIFPHPENNRSQTPSIISALTDLNINIHLTSTPQTKYPPLIRKSLPIPRHRTPKVILSQNNTKRHQRTGCYKHRPPKCQDEIPLQQILPHRNIAKEPVPEGPGTDGLTYLAGEVIVCSCIYYSTSLFCTIAVAFVVIVVGIFLS